MQHSSSNTVVREQALLVQKELATGGKCGLMVPAVIPHQNARTQGAFPGRRLLDAEVSAAEKGWSLGIVVFISQHQPQPSSFTFSDPPLKSISSKQVTKINVTHDDLTLTRTSDDNDG